MDRRFADLDDIARFQPLRVGQMLVVVEQLRVGLGRLNKRMSLGQRDMRNNGILGQAGHQDRGVFPTADGQRQLMLVEPAFTARITDKIHAFQIGSSQRTDKGGRGTPGLTRITRRTSRYPGLLPTTV
jgi:hypothetical protein